MAELTPEHRAALPSKDFGLPEKATTARAKEESGKYPIPDRGLAVSAKRLAKKNHEAGNLTDDEFERISRKADRKLKKT